MIGPALRVRRSYSDIGKKMRGAANSCLLWVSACVILFAGEILA
jgi:hypothetical protein